MRTGISQRFHCFPTTPARGHAVRAFGVLVCVCFALSISQSGLSSVPFSSVTPDPRWHIIPKDSEHVSTLIPGAVATQSFVVTGRYAPGSEVRVWRGDARWEAADPHACMEVEVNDVRLRHGASRARKIELPVSARSTAPEGDVPDASDVDGAKAQEELRITLIAQDDCGWLQDDRVRAIPIRFALEGEGEVGARQIEPRYVLTNRSALPEDTGMFVRAGDAVRTLPWAITSESRHPQEFDVRIERERAAPSLPRCLEIALVDEDDEPEDSDRDVRTFTRTSLTTEIGGERAEAALKIYAHAHADCQPGTYSIPIRVKNLSTKRVGVRDEIRALELTIRPATFWVRWRWAVWIGVGTGALILLVSAVVGMRRNKKRAETTTMPPDAQG